MYDTIYSLFESDISKATKGFYSRKLNHYYDKCDKLYKKLKELLDKDGIKMLNDYYDSIPEIVYEEKRRAFLCGVQTGARLMIEIFTDDQDR